MTFRSVAALLALALTASAQTTFEVATLRPADPNRPRTTPSEIRIAAQRVSVIGMPLKQLITMAYGVTADRLEGMPVPALSVDIQATIPAGAAPSRVPAMLQSLLEERFKMTTHRGTKVTDFYAILIGKDGVKLAKSEPDQNDYSNFAWGTTRLEKGASIFQSGSTRTREEPGRMRVQMSTVADIAALLHPHYGGVPVEDRTGLQGTYDIRIEYPVPDYARARADGRLTSDYVSDLRDAIRTGVINEIGKLGLRIEKQHGEIPTLVIDRLEKTPTEN